MNKLDMLNTVALSSDWIYGEGDKEGTPKIIDIEQTTRTLRNQLRRGWDARVEVLRNKARWLRYSYDRIGTVLPHDAREPDVFYRLLRVCKRLEQATKLKNPWMST